MEVSHVLLYYYDLRFVDFANFGLEEAEKFSLDLWRIFRTTLFPAVTCDEPKVVMVQ